MTLRFLKHAGWPVPACDFTSEATPVSIEEMGKYRIHPDCPGSASFQYGLLFRKRPAAIEADDHFLAAGTRRCHSLPPGTGRILDASRHVLGEKMKLILAFCLTLALCFSAFGQQGRGTDTAPGLNKNGTGITLRAAQQTLVNTPTDCQALITFATAEGDVADYWDETVPARATILKDGYYLISYGETATTASGGILDFQGNIRIYNADNTPYAPINGFDGYYAVIGQHWGQCSNSAAVFLTAGQYITLKICVSNSIVLRHAQLTVVSLT
jgi:hypothetical protein